MLRSLVLLAGMGLVPPLAQGAPVTFGAADGVTVYARPYAGPQADAPWILLFHQAGSNKNEYSPIAPRLNQLGYNALAVDQRSGGDLYAPGNETVSHLGRSEPYEKALLDLEGALSYVRHAHPAARVYVLGSSYSAALVFELAAKHPKDVSAVIAFSPGEYLAAKNAVHAAARNVRVPIFVDSAADKEEIGNAKSILAASPSKQKVQFVPQTGVHGASTLRADKDPGGYEDNWRALIAFLRSLPK
jgi:dienelactone hydrolase